MELLTEKKNCCGCSACEAVCPKGAITMVADKEGFLYPDINHSICVECGLCKNVCEFNEDYNKSNILEKPIVLGVKHKELKERMTSRSGGMFAAVAEQIIFNKGSVYGAVLAEDFSVEHQRAGDKESWRKFKSSKYVQSNMKQMFPKVKKDLEDGKDVLFSGTPCQVAGLKSYLNRKNIDQKNLICCDIVCHGVPSPLIWKEYVQFFQKKYHNKIEKFIFRDKDFGWGAHMESLVLNNGKKISQRYYTELFYRHIMLRPSCEICPFTNTKRQADITLADFWGIDKVAPEFDDDKGVSLIFLNTEKGIAVFDMVKEKLETKKFNLEDCMQNNLIRPTEFSKDRNMFWADYEKNGFPFVMKKYAGYTWKKRIKKKVKKILKLEK